MRGTNDGKLDGGKLHSHAFTTNVTIPGYPVIGPDPLRFPVDTRAKVGRGDCHGHTLHAERMNGVLTVAFQRITTRINRGKFRSQKETFHLYPPRHRVFDTPLDIIGSARVTGVNHANVQ